MSSLPEVIGPYKIQSVIGRGGMGVVYEARRQDGSGEAVALKALESLNEMGLHRMRHEIEALKRIRHPHIPRLLEEGQHLNAPWYAMTLHSGHTLDWYIREVHRRAKKRPFAPDQGIPSGIKRILGWINQLCQTMAWLHGEGYIHCDLKPENIIIDKGSTPILVDFGVVARFGTRVAPRSLETSGLMAGTADYISPEQIRGGLVDARADLYALGCILYEVLTGAPPFGASEQRELLELHLEGTPNTPSDHQPWVPEHLDELISGLLSKTPQERPGHAHAIRETLRTLNLEEVDGSALPLPKPYLYKPTLVGRQGLMKSLRKRLRKATKGDKTTLLLGGESGSGKSRVALELLRYARSRRILALTGQCNSLQGDNKVANAPLHAFVPLLQVVADRCLEGGQEESERILGEHGPILTPYAPFLRNLPGQEVLPTPIYLSPHASQKRVFKALLGTLRSLAGTDPLLIVLDDVHWADELSQVCLKALARWIKTHDVPWMLLGLYRNEGVSHNAGLENLIHSEAFEVHQLERLADEDVRSILHDMLGLDRLDEALTSFLTKRSQGNPLNAAEYLRAVVEQGILDRDHAGSWHLDRSNTQWKESLSGLIALPTLQETFLRTLEGFSPAALHVAQATAILGRECDIDLLGELTSTETLTTSLAELQQREVLEVTEERVRFRHERLRQAITDHMTPQQRVALHGRAAITLSSLAEAGAAVAPTTLGYHWASSGQTALASRVYFEAAQNAAASGARRDARTLYEHGLGLLDLEDHTALAARLDMVQYVLMPGEERAQASIALDRVGAHLPEGEHPLRARWLLLRGQLALHDYQLVEAIASLTQALTVFEALGDGRGARRALQLSGTALVMRGFLTRAVEQLRRALDHKTDPEEEDAQNEYTSVEPILDLGLALYRLGRHAAANLRLRNALKQARSIGDRRQEGRALCMLGMLNSVQGRNALAEDMVQESLQISIEVYDSSGMAHATLERARLARRAGHYNQAREQATALLNMSAMTTLPAIQGEVLMLLGDLDRDRGHQDEAMQRYEQAQQIFRKSGQVYHEHDLLCRLGNLFSMQGKHLKAQALFEQALRYARTQNAIPLEGYAQVGLGGTALALGDLERAHTVLNRALDCAYQCLDGRLEGDVLLHKARLYRYDNRSQHARYMLEQVYQRFQELGDLSLLARHLVEEGHLNLQMGKNIQDLVMELLRVADAMASTPTSAIGRQIATLQRAYHAQRNGTQLMYGQQTSDLPASLQPEASM